MKSSKRRSEEEYNHRKKRLDARADGMTLSNIAQIDSLDIPDGLKKVLKLDEVIRNKQIKEGIKRRLDHEYKDENGEFYDSFFTDIESDGSVDSCSSTIEALSKFLDSISEPVY